MKITEVVSSSWLNGPFYHGTARSNLAFDPDLVSYWASNPDDALSHARSDAEIDAGIPFVIRARLKSRSPVLIDYSVLQSLHLPPEQLAKLAQVGHDIHHTDYRLMQDLHLFPGIVAKLLQAGYDLVFSPYPGEAEARVREVCVLDRRIIQVEETTPVEPLENQNARPYEPR